MLCHKTGLNVVCNCNEPPRVFNKDNSCQCKCGQICKECARQKTLKDLETWRSNHKPEEGETKDER